MTKNVSHNKSWNLGVMQKHVEPPPTPLIKIKQDNKSNKYFVKIKLRRYTVSSSSDL